MAGTKWSSILIQTKFIRKEKREFHNSTGAAPSSVKYLSDGWGKLLERMLPFTRAAMNEHVANSGKRVANTEKHSIPTNLKKAKTFLQDEYLKDIEANNDQRYFYF